MNADTTSAEREERLGEIISDLLESQEAGHATDPQEWLTRYPEFAEELTEFLKTEQQVRVLAVPLRQAAQEAMVDTPLPWNKLFAPASNPRNEEVPVSLADYELLEEIGRGGMAVVYRARQKRLERFVALKLFRADGLGRAAELQRFRHEAEIVANLDHPQIVPVYDVGESGGQGFFTMKLIEGGSLDTQLACFTSRPQAAARLTASIARAVHHAHQRGILHRDLKPSNILLTGNPATAPEECVPHVSDFGLAKRVGTELGLTHSGAVVGTPAYMAPEQAASEKNAITTATDVYGLGTLLYALLTGRAPFGGSSVLDVLSQVKDKEPERPRNINAKVPRDLETICLKCLSKEPHRRYESAAAIAEDLERWLRGEPILARRVGPVERLWCWCRRQPVQAALATALIVAVAVGFGLVLRQWQRAEDNFASANSLRQQAVDREAAVEGNYQIALQAVRDISGLLGDNGQLELHGMDPLRLELLKKTQGHVQRLLERQPQDPALRLSLAEGAAAIADSIRLTGSPAEALVAYRRAVELFEELQKEDPERASLSQALALLHNQIGSVHTSVGQHNEAMESVKRARSILEHALSVHPTDASLQSSLASTHHNIGMNFVALNRLDAAMASYIESRKLYEKLLRDQPGHPEYQRLLANTLNSLAMAQTQMGQPNEAVLTFQKAVELSEPLAKRYPEKRLLTHALAQQLCNLADVLYLRDRPKEALEVLELARPILEELLRVNSSVPYFRFTFALCHVNLGRVRLKLGETEQGFESFEIARSTFRSLAQEQPRIVDYQRRLSAMLLDLGKIHSNMHHREQTFDAYGEARDVIKRLANAYPQEPEYLSWQGTLMNDLAVAQGEMVSLGDARISVLEAINFQQRALKMRAGELRYLSLLAGHYRLLAAIERALGNIEGAVIALKKRIEILPNNAGELYAVARDCVLTGNAAKSGTTRQERCYDLAIEALRLAVKAGFRNVDQTTNDPALAPLHPRGDFQELLGEMKEAKSPDPQRKGKP
jgi:serine/threonine-protein kinase